MRQLNRSKIENVVTPTHFELGLLTSAYLMEEYGTQSNPFAFELLANYISGLKKLGYELDDKMESIIDKMNGSVLMLCGMESMIADIVIPKFESVIIVPNSETVNFDRVKNNYADHKNLQVLTPNVASDIICPDTTILVPTYPLEDGTLLSYGYPSKLLTVDALGISYQIFSLEICEPLPITYGADDSGLSSVFTIMDPNYFTNFLRLNYDNN